MNAPPSTAAGSRTDYAGAVYGSLLAASVVATAGTLGEFPRLQLILMLIVTGLVFWAAHVYAHLVGERSPGRPWDWRETHRVAAHEWPIAQAACLPAALGTAVTQQVVWASLGAARSGAGRRQMIVEGTVNLLLGLIIVAAKAALTH